MINKHILGSIKTSKFFKEVKPNCAFQFFSKSPRIYLPKTPPQNLEDVGKKINKINAFPVIHCAYMVMLKNIFLPKSFDSLVYEINFIINLKLTVPAFIVMHFGTKISEKQYIKGIETLSKITKKYIKNHNIYILLENNVHGPKFEIIISIDKKIRKKNENYINIGYCLDIAHVWGDGIDIRTVELARQFLESLNSLPILICHLNPPKMEFGKIIDRHGNFDSTPMQQKVLKFIIRFFAEKKVPMIIENANEFDISRAEAMLEN